MAGPRSNSLSCRAGVVRIDRQGDSLKNGAIIGAVIGGVTGALTAGGLADCPGAHSPCTGARVAGFFIATGVWTAIGVGIDALIPGRTLLWKPSLGWKIKH